MEDKDESKGREVMSDEQEDMCSIMSKRTLHRQCLLNTHGGSEARY